LGLCYMRLGQQTDAQKIYEAAIKRGIDTSGFRMNLGVIALSQKDFARGQTELEKAIALDPLNVSAYFHLADLLPIKAETAKSIDFYKKSLQINPDFIYSINGLGMAYAAMKNNEKSVEYFQKAIQLEPQNPVGYFNLAVELDMIGRSADAVEMYKKFLSFN